MLDRNARMYPEGRTSRTNTPEFNEKSALLLGHWFSTHPPYDHDEYPSNKLVRVAHVSEFRGVQFKGGRTDGEFANGTWVLCPDCFQVHMCGWVDGHAMPNPRKCDRCGKDFSSADYFQPVYERGNTTGTTFPAPSDPEVIARARTTVLEAKTLREKIDRAYYAAVAPEFAVLDGQWTSLRSGIARRAARAMAWRLGIAPGELEFIPVKKFFGDVAPQVFADFSHAVVLKLKNDDSVTFFWGKLKSGACADKCASGVWMVSPCSHCSAPTIWGEHVHSLAALRWAPSAGGPWWHLGGCKVTTLSEPCH